MEALLLAVMGLSNVLCFFLGAKIGQTVTRGERIETPVINPMQAVREHKDKKKAREEQNVLDTIMENIDNYDGTSLGQKDIPGR